MFECVKHEPQRVESKEQLRDDVLFERAHCDVPLRAASNARRRRSVRLPQYDYAQDGMYFVTICTHNREELFGEISVGAHCNVPRLNEFGKIVEREILNTGKIRHNVCIEPYVIMPNHVHFVVSIGAHCNVPLRETFGQSTKNSLPTIVKLIKSTTTKQINVLRNTPGADVWQRNYFEHVIRDERSYKNIAEYILNNPVQWADDEYCLAGALQCVESKET